MPPKFSFEGALSAPFKSAHFNSFPWLFSLAFATLATALLLLLGFLARDAFVEVFNTFQTLDRTLANEEDPEVVFGAIFGALSPLTPYLIMSIIGSWIFWAVFQAASMRRYIRDETFSLRFGRDEINIMVVAIGWWLLMALFYAVPVMMIWGTFSNLLEASVDGMTDAEIESQIVGGIFGSLGLMLVLFPVYVFLATRLAPCFGLTIKEERIRFFDAWNVSRGRFWPILGAFVILAIAFAVLSGVISQIFQMVLMFALIPMFEALEGGADVGEVFTSLPFLFGVGLYLFVTYFLAGLQMHTVHAPAAFAARHDPRGGVDDQHQLSAFE